MKPTRVFAIAVITLLFCISSIGCGGSGSGSGGGSGENDRSTLPVIAPAFEISPLQFPNGVSTDLTGLGIYNLTSACDVVHYGWDFMPTWSSYPENKVPVVAVADGLIVGITLLATNTYQGQDHNTYVIVLAVAREVDVHYTFEPFITFEGTYASQWIEVAEGDTVSAGDVLGYLPKVDGNLGENLIHIDWKIGTGSTLNDYVCPTDYFSDQWQQDNSQILIGKITGTCTALCYE